MSGSFRNRRLRSEYDDHCEWCARAEISRRWHEIGDDDCSRRLASRAYAGWDFDASATSFVFLFITHTEKNS